MEMQFTENLPAWTEIEIETPKIYMSVDSLMDVLSNKQETAYAQNWNGKTKL